MEEVEKIKPPSSSPTQITTASGEASAVSSSDINNRNPAAESQQPKKKQRCQPGMPDPEAEVIALSPKTLLATNRFVCEICGKGFQRDQNLQLHRRGHNLPWKLRQRSAVDQVRKRVYVCPEASCIHHDPKRALGDLTGIKKHFCRKHGEKKWKCERCSKRYAVQSDWKAHMKTCGTKEYKCDCGTIFSRRDSFVTHRAFCDALAQESAKVQSFGGAAMGLPELKNVVGSGGGGGQSSGSTAVEGTVLSPVLSIQSSELPVSTPSMTEPSSLSASNLLIGNGNSLYAGMFAPVVLTPQSPHQGTSTLANMMAAAAAPTSLQQHPAVSFSFPHTMVNESTSLSLSSFYPFSSTAFSGALPSQPQPALSATALLQKAAQMGSATSSSSLLGGFSMGGAPHVSTTNLQWNVKIENGGNSMEDGLLRLGLPSDHSVFGASGPMVDTSSGFLFGSRPTTLDLLGLGIAPGNASTGGLSAFFSSMDQGLDVVGPWDAPPPERKPNQTVP